MSESGRSERVIRAEVPQEAERSGITERWIRSMLLIVMAVLAVAAILGFFILRRSYYTTAQLHLTSEYSDAVEAFFTSAYQSGGEEGFESAARDYVESFGDKDIMDVWIIDKDGQVILSSSGFEASGENMVDYEAAKTSDTQSARRTSTTRSGERIMAVTYRINLGTQNIGAIRYVMSLRGVDNQLVILALGLLALYLLVVGLVIVTGYFFVSSIVKPVREINEVTKRIAAGDMDARLEPQEHDDEISELCENINYMADELASTDKMKNDFISTVSHEMKTPLTAIKGWAETLSTGEVDPALFKRGMEIIIEESSRLTNVVNDLLDLSKIVNGRLTLKYEKLDVLAELDETIFLFKDRSMREGIDLVYNVPHIPAPAEGDPTRIKQVFENLLDNAFKYTEQGGTVTVAADVLPPASEDGKGTLRVYVEDTGCGIAKEDLPNVKKKFYKSNISVSGSGIGLAVCDEIIRMHGGTLDLESELGVGTCVIITIPVDYVKVEADLTDAVREATAEFEPVGGGNTPIETENSIESTDET